MNVEATNVSASEVLVETDDRRPFLRCKGKDATALLLASNLAMVLATWLAPETRDAGLSNPYPGA